MSLEKASKNAAWGGSIIKCKARSSALGGLETTFNVFLPAGEGPFPVLYYLAGLTCTEDTGAQKGGFLRDAAGHGIAIVFPDTSPRGAGIDEEGFYIDATKAPYSKHYNGETFITQEMPSLLAQSDLPLDLERASIFGHSMGGHGALSLYLKHPGQYRSASAFAPICEPTRCSWGEKAFNGYLEGGVDEGIKHDTVSLLKESLAKDIHIRIDVGLADNFYKEGQLRPESLRDAAKVQGLEGGQIDIHLHEGYDHSYWFIQTFGPDHLAFHAKHLAVRTAKGL